ncbi:hypothetical protein P7K49_032622, partial [Saguinus oedipus]
MRLMPRSPPFSGTAHAKPRPLTCEATCLAGAHSTDQSQQGQPRGPEHPPAVVVAQGSGPLPSSLGLSYARAYRGQSFLDPEKGTLCPLHCCGGNGFRGSTAGSSPLCLLVNVHHCHG